MKLALLQLNYTVGDFAGNARKIAAGVKRFSKEEVDLCITSELSLIGYPPRDLILQKSFIQETGKTLSDLAAELKGYPPVLVGTILSNNSSKGRPAYNAAMLLCNGKVEQSFIKTLLPTYDVFDEDRYFEPSDDPGVLEFQGKRIGITICEDIWNDKDFWSRLRYANDPIELIMARGNIDYIVNMSASPFSVGKHQIREAMFKSIAQKHSVPILFVNQVGGNDDLVFDGRSCVIDHNGTLLSRAKAFEEDVLLFNPDLNSNIEPDNFEPESEIWRALILGTRDYVKKCGFKSVLLGLSGGVDSALTAMIAAEAIGSENVTGVLMPSSFSSKGSIDDALELARRIGIKTFTLPIEPMMKTFSASLQEVFKGYQEDVTEENIQSRIRGNLLMALSNKFGSLLLTTGNKSELAVGYCTIYGDMSGGLAVIADVPKTMIYRIANWINKTKGEMIPRSIIEKAPSAELRPNQTDQDSLPPYDLLDQILERHIEHHEGEDEIIAAGFDPVIVRKVLRLIRIAEFKRKQAAPGLKVTDRAFGTGWRMPIARK